MPPAPAHGCWAVVPTGIRSRPTLPRTGGDSRDAIRTEWEIRILRGINRPKSENQSMVRTTIYRAPSLVVGRDWHETMAAAAHSASFGGLGQFRLPGTEPVCYPLYNPLMSDQFCT